MARAAGRASCRMAKASSQSALARLKMRLPAGSSGLNGDHEANGIKDLSAIRIEEQSWPEMPFLF